MYDHGFMDNTNRQAVKNWLDSQTRDASLTSWRQPYKMAAFIRACACWALYVVTLTNTVHFIYTYIYIYVQRIPSLSYATLSCSIRSVHFTLNTIHTFAIYMWQIWQYYSISVSIHLCSFYQVQIKLQLVLNWKSIYTCLLYRFAIIRLRASSHSSDIERGWHTKPKTPITERLCPCCNVVDNKHHFLISYKIYDQDRSRIFPIWYQQIMKISV